MTQTRGVAADIGSLNPALGIMGPDTKFFEKLFLKNFYSEITIGNYGKKYMVPSNTSNIAVFKFWDNATAKTTALTEGVTPASTNLKLNRKEVEIEQYGNFYIFTDRALDEGVEEAWAYGSEASGEEARLTENQIVYTALQGGTNAIFSGTGNTQTSEVAAGDVLTTANLDSAISGLRTAYAKKVVELAKGSANVGTLPVQACYLMFVHEDMKLQIEDLDGVQTVEKYANSGSALNPGEFAKYKEVRFVADTDIPFSATGGTGSVAVYKHIMFGREAFGVTYLGPANHELIKTELGGGGSGSDPLKQRATVGWKMRVAAIILYDNHIVRIESALV